MTIPIAASLKMTEISILPLRSKDEHDEREPRKQPEFEIEFSSRLGFARRLLPQGVQPRRLRRKERRLRTGIPPSELLKIPLSLCPLLFGEEGKGKRRFSLFTEFGERFFKLPS